VPQQALFLMNSPFVIEQARALASTTETNPAATAADKISALYRRIFNRTPEADELAIGEQFIATAAQDVTGVKLSPWEQYAQLLLLTNEAMYID